MPTEDRKWIPSAVIAVLGSASAVGTALKGAPWWGWVICGAVTGALLFIEVSRRFVMDMLEERKNTAVAWQLLSKESQHREALAWAKAEAEADLRHKWISKISSAELAISLSNMVLQGEADATDDQRKKLRLEKMIADNEMVMDSWKDLPKRVPGEAIATLVHA